MTDAFKNSVGDHYVYTGVWTNWSHGSWRGATITLTHRDGGLLTAFLALFVTVVGRSFWRLFCFAAHSLLSSGDTLPQDGLYHQRQAILRNTDESVAGLQRLVELVWKWRSRSQRLWLRTLPLIGATIFVTATFYVASIFSSQISTTTGDEVLVSSPNCGSAALSSSNINDYYRLAPYFSKLYFSSAAYSQQCYGDNEASQECSTFVKSSLPRTISRHGKCPFDERVCRQNSTALCIDTGMINSHLDLGINAAPKDRFEFRYVVECSPLKIDAYASTNSSSGNTQYYYGRTVSDRPDDGPYTYAYPYIPENATGESGRIGHNSDYVMDNYLYTPNAGANWKPIPELQRDDAEVMIVFLSANLINYVEPVDDEWFSAHQPGEQIHRSDNVNGSMQTYLTDNAANPLACTNQWQFCNPSTKSCTPLGAFGDAYAASSNIFRPGNQNETFNFWFTETHVVDPQVSDVIAVLGIGALTARDTLGTGLQGPLPSDQWQQEVLSWMDTALALIQKVGVEQAAGPTGVSDKEFIQKPSNSNMCKNQKIRNTSHTSFSILGLSLTLILGGVIIIFELSVEHVLQIVQRRYKKGLYQRLEWVSNEVLQIQRMTHEAIGSGTWIGAASSIPITTIDEKLAALDISNADHPHLIEALPYKSKDKLSVSNDEESAISAPEPTAGRDRGPQGTEQHNTYNGKHMPQPQVTDRSSTSEYDVSPIDDQSSHAALVYMTQHSACGDHSPLPNAQDESRA